MEQVVDHSRAQRLKKYVDRFQDAHVLVIGDIIMDEYIWGEVSRISPEAPVPVVRVKHETKMLGGAANVINNMVSLGAKPIICGVVGEDDTGTSILEDIRAKGLKTDGIVIEKKRPTSIKTRIVAHSQQVVRFDRESLKNIRKESTRAIVLFIKKNLNNLDAIVISDYGKGVISPSLMKDVRELARSAPGKKSVSIAVDPKVCNFKHYRDADVITPNHHEAGAFCGFEIADEKSLHRAGEKILKDLNCRSVLITQGKEGMTLFEDNSEITHIPTVAKKVFDVTGAGDTVISTFSLGLASGLDLKSAAILSNYAAGIVVGEVGTSTVDAKILKEAVGNNDG